MNSDPIKGAYNVTLQVTIQIVPDDGEDMAAWEASAIAHTFVYDSVRSDDPGLKVLFIRAYDPVPVMVPPS